MKNPILLGEAPKGEKLYPFDWNAWTTHRLSEAIGFRASNIHRYFRPRNILSDIQDTGPDHFDSFDHSQALKNLDNLINAGDRVICVGSRVTQVVAEYFALNSHEVEVYVPFCSWGTPLRDFQFARIPHPANRLGRWCYRNGHKALPEYTVRFLIATIRERYSDSFGHHSF